jgi:hypothetical protein
VVIELPSDICGTIVPDPLAERLPAAGCAEVLMKLNEYAIRFRAVRA